MSKRFSKDKYEGHIFPGFERAYDIYKEAENLGLFDDTPSTSTQQSSESKPRIDVPSSGPSTFSALDYVYLISLGLSGLCFIVGAISQSEELLVASGVIFGIIWFFSLFDTRK
jgi:hypothetical protein